MAEENVEVTLAEITTLFKCVIGNEHAIYISVPITTGQRFLTWYSKTGKHLSKADYGDAHFKEVIQPNLQDAQEFINQIRESHECIVVEPTSLNIASWSQTDYHSFWKTVIELYINKVYFLDGWYLSKGCSLEFLASCKKGIDIYDQKKHPLTLKEGTSLIKKGISEYEKLGLDVKFQSKIYAELSDLI